MSDRRIVVIGAGVGGLAAAVALARHGMQVTVLEAHIYPGGCAGTYYHQGFRFDAGATLAAGFYPGGPMDLLALEAGIPSWPARPLDPVMVVHYPGGSETVIHNTHNGELHQPPFDSPADRRFWKWQATTASALWDLALRLPDWPPSDLQQAMGLIGSGFAWLSERLKNHSPLSIFALGLDAFRSSARRLDRASELLHLFVDGQLLISAQATADRANALYAASALDLPRRGVVELEGGIGAVAQILAKAVRQNGGEVRYRNRVSRILFSGMHPAGVETTRGEFFPADEVIVNLPPQNLAALLPDNAPGTLRKRLSAPLPDDAWGAFMVYIGLANGNAAQGLPLHHQVLQRLPLGEGNSVFISLSPEWDPSRAPAGGRAITLSTHTRLAPWRQLTALDRPAYEARKEAYTRRMLAALDVIHPALRQDAKLILPGTPLTFERFTHRHMGWVGGFPQTSLLRFWPTKLAQGLWLVGDSVFPGQSMPAVALSGLRVARSLM